jgi:hypothetical protein
LSLNGFGGVGTHRPAKRIHWLKAHTSQMPTYTPVGTPKVNDFFKVLRNVPKPLIVRKMPQKARI